MALYLLDADAVADYGHRVPASSALIEDLFLQNHQVCVSDVVVAEVYSGLRPTQLVRTETLLGRCRFLLTEMQAALRAGRWRYDFARQGVQLAVTDCLIAATAWQHGATVVTGNTRHFPMDEVTLLPLPRAR